MFFKSTPDCWSEIVLSGPAAGGRPSGAPYEYCLFVCMFVCLWVDLCMSVCMYVFLCVGLYAHVCLVYMSRQSRYLFDSHSVTIVVLGSRHHSPVCDKGPKCEVKV